MIVAIYANEFTIVLPVHPVNRIDRSAPEGRKQQRAKHSPYSFAAILDTAMAAEDPDDAHTFDALA